jgi:hypothetical protein
MSVTLAQITSQSLKTIIGVAPNFEGFDSCACKISVVTNENDYKRALFHYTFAVGQETQTAQDSASNMVRSHQAARLQSCNQNARAVTDGHGKPVRDGFFQIVINY